MTTETTTDLPTWDEMSNVDKGAVLLHLHKRNWEGAEYATSDYPAKYFDDPRLLALSKRDACRHAVKVGVSAEAAFNLLGEAEHDRLYDLALAEPDRRCLWGAQYPEWMPGCKNRVAITSYSTDPKEAARELIASWAAQGYPGGVLLHRSEPGGEWTEVSR